MSEAPQPPPPVQAQPRAGATAGALLRAAREKQGLHLAALAASIKVTPRKLEALETDRYDELPDATFARALAQTVCRSLRIDPAPVLALLPRADPSALDNAGGTLNTPFRERPGRESASRLAAAAVRPLVWAAAALLVAAALVYLLPAGLWRSASDTAQPSAVVPATASVAPDAAVDGARAATPQPAAPDAPQPPAFVPLPSASAAPVVVTNASPAPAVTNPVAPPAVANAAPAAASAASAALVEIRAEVASWVEVRDGRGRVLVSRVLQASESAGFDGALPIKLTIGNASGTRLRFRGRPVDLMANTRDNVARIELQ